MNIVKREIMPLFPSLLFISKVDDKEFLKDLTQRILKLKLNELGTGSSSGWWSYDDLHTLEEFEDVTELFLQQSEEVLNYYEVDRESHYLTTMWANIAIKPEYSHQLHVHPNSMFSGVFQVSMPDNCTGTSFADPRPGARMIEPTYSKMSAINAGVANPPGEEGQLIIFPSYLPHSVHSISDGFKGRKNRITISFNVMITGQIKTRTAKLTLK